MVDLKNLPLGVDLGRISSLVFEVLAEHTAFPWPVMVAQCQRCGFDPVDLNAEQLEQVISHLARGVARFTSPAKAESVERELTRIARMER